MSKEKWTEVNIDSFGKSLELWKAEANPNSKEAYERFKARLKPVGKGR